MLALKRYPTPAWTWLPPVQPTEIYTWSLFRLERERYWQIAWNEYTKRRTSFQRDYKSKPSDNRLWQEVGEVLYMEMLDPQLFIELLFEHYMRNDRPRPPEPSEILPKLETFGLWYDETYRPDAESRIYLAGSNLNNLISRYTDTDTGYWLSKDPEQYEPYFHLLYGASGHLDRKTAVIALRQIKELPILRSLEEYGLWPVDAKEKLLAARHHLKPLPPDDNPADNQENPL